MKFISVKNWAKFQHYKNEKPAWIKCYRDLLSDVDFLSLSLSERGKLLCLWLAAAQTNNKISADEEKLKILLRSSDVSITKLVKAGFIAFTGDSIDSLGTLYKDSRETLVLEETEKRREELETEEEESALESVAPPDLKKLWNDNRGLLPEMLTITDKRKRLWASRWREMPDEAYWVSVIQKLADSPFCRGENERGWVATIDFLLKPDTRIKVMENRYKPTAQVSKGDIRYKNNLEAARQALEERQRHAHS